MATVPETVFVEGSGKAFNTVPPSDFGFFELMNEVVQNEPAGSTDAELMGQLAAIGIVKGQPFEPDERMRAHPRGCGRRRQRDLAGAVLQRREPRRGSRTTTSSAWFNMLWVGGYTFETPPPLVTKEGIKPFPATGARKLHSRTSFIYAATVRLPCDVHAAHGHRVAVPDGRQGRRRRAARRREDLPGDAAAGHPGGPLLVDHRSTTTRRARCSRRRSASRVPGASPTRLRRRPPTPTARRPSRSARSGRPTVPRATGSRPTEGKGWFPILRLYSPLQPFFDKSWRPSEIEAVN